MKVVRPSVILLCGQDSDAVAQVRRLLTESGHDVRCTRSDETDLDELTSYHLAIVEASGCHEQSLAWCRRVLARSIEPILPILFITPDTSPAARLAGLEAGADTYLLRPFLTEELLGQ